MAVAQYIGDVKRLSNRRKRRQERLQKLREAPLFTCLNGPCKKQETFANVTPFRIGRGHNNQFTLATAGVAGLHAVVNKDGLGRYSVMAVHPDEQPVFVRRNGRFQPISRMLLYDRAVIRLGFHGPHIRFRYLGGRDSRTGATVSGGMQDPLLPESQVRTRLEQMWMGDRLGDQDRHYVNQATRYMGTLNSYRKILLTGSVGFIAVMILLIYNQVLLGQSKTELKTAREQLNNNWAWSQQEETAEEEDSGQTQENDRTNALLESDRTARGIRDILKSSGVQEPEITLRLVKMVKAQIDSEVTRLKRNSDLEGFLERYERYHPQIVKTFKENFQLPASLAYVAWIESDYYLDMESEKGALGMWQFIAPTARQYKLITDRGEDYRQDFRRSTRAAGQFLSDLLARYGLNNLQVAVAAYNLGPRRIEDIYRRHRLWKPPQRTFESLLRRKGWKGRSVLPDETINYVPRFFAANLIGADRGFYLGQ